MRSCRGGLVFLAVQAVACSSHDGNEDSGTVALFTSSGTSSTSLSPGNGAEPTSSSGHAPPGDTDTIGATVDTSLTGTSSAAASSTATGAEADSSGTTWHPTDCGDGEIDPGEECDHGYLGNSEAGECKLDCQLAWCGDEEVYEGEEDCDRGTDNNDTAYNGCTTHCEFGPRCGDEIVQADAGEECDLGELNGTGSSPLAVTPCDEGCRFEARIVFVSSATYRGGEVDGVSGADAHCQQLAKDAKLDNSSAFLAWISAGAANPATRFKIGAEMNGVPYVLPGGSLVAEDWNDLLAKGVGEGIVQDEQEKDAGKVVVWTNTDKIGQTFSLTNDCDGWVSSSPALKARVGKSSVDLSDPEAVSKWKNENQWTSFMSDTCNFQRRLYCFEQ